MEPTEKPLLAMMTKMWNMGLHSWNGRRNGVLGVWDVIDFSSTHISLFYGIAWVRSREHLAPSYQCNIKCMIIYDCMADYYEHGHSGAMCF